MCCVFHVSCVKGTCDNVYMDSQHSHLKGPANIHRTLHTGLFVATLACKSMHTHAVKNAERLSEIQVPVKILRMFCIDLSGCTSA